MSKQCKGFRRFGGAFTMGAPTWVQCEETGIVMLKIEGEDKMPACEKCWIETIETGIKIEEVLPMRST